MEVGLEGVARSEGVVDSAVLVAVAVCSVVVVVDLVEEAGAGGEAERVPETPSRSCISFRSHELLGKAHCAVGWCD